MAISNVSTERSIRLLRKRWAQSGVHLASAQYMPSTARDLMNPDPITMGYDMPLLQAQHLFVMLQISGAPVVDARDRVVGVISSSDLLRIVDQVCDEDIDPMPRPTADGLPERLSALSVGDIATPEVVWVAPETSVSSVATLMRTEGIHRVLVGTSSRLEGILTAFDLLEALAEPHEVGGLHVVPH